MRFSPQLERAVTAAYEPGAIRKVYKDNTRNTAASRKVAELLAGVDYLIAGVGP